MLDPTHIPQGCDPLPQRLLNGVRGSQSLECHRLLPRSARRQSYNLAADMGMAVDQPRDDRLSIEIHRRRSFPLRARRRHLDNVRALDYDIGPF
jgi:hypothetical protein